MSTTDTVTNAAKIAEWRRNHEWQRLTEPALRDILGVANLQGANLQGENLQDTDLQGANLGNANLQGADLRNADLRDADLQGADLRYANLRYANLWGTDLEGADLQGANLGNANLRYANLRDANLRDANLWGGMAISTPSGSGYFIPTAEGWRITIGCWSNKTLDELRALVETDVDWPEATGVERDRRRPILAAQLALCEAHAEYHTDKLTTAVEKWGANA